MSSGQVEIRFPAVRLRRGGDLDTWVMIFETFALQKSVYDNISGTTKRPASSPTSSTSPAAGPGTSGGPTPVAEPTKAQRDWDAKDLLAQVILFAAIDEDIASAIRPTLPSDPRQRTSRDMYLRILQTFRPNVASQVVGLHRQLQRRKLRHSERVTEFLGDVDGLVRQLCAAESRTYGVDEVLKWVAAGLPSSYDTKMDIVMESHGRGELTMERLRMALLEKEQQLHQDDELVDDEDQAVAFTMRSPRRAGRFRGKCYECGHTGHIARDCPDRSDYSEWRGDDRDRRTGREVEQRERHGDDRDRRTTWDWDFDGRAGDRARYRSRCEDNKDEDHDERGGWGRAGGGRGRRRGSRTAEVNYVDGDFASINLLGLRGPVAHLDNPSIPGKRNGGRDGTPDGNPAACGHVHTAIGTRCVRGAGDTHNGTSSDSDVMPDSLEARRSPDLAWRLASGMGRCGTRDQGERGTATALRVPEGMDSVDGAARRPLAPERKVDVGFFGGDSISDAARKVPTPEAPPGTPTTSSSSWADDECDETFWVDRDMGMYHLGDADIFHWRNGNAAGMLV